MQHLVEARFPTWSANPSQPSSDVYGRLKYIATVEKVSRAFTPAKPRTFGATNPCTSARRVHFFTQGAASRPGGASLHTSVGRSALNTCPPSRHCKTFAALPVLVSTVSVPDEAVRGRMALILKVFIRLCSVSLISCGEVQSEAAWCCKPGCGKHTGS